MQHNFETRTHLTVNPDIYKVLVYAHSGDQALRQGNWMRDLFRKETLFLYYAPGSSLLLAVACMSCSSVWVVTPVLIKCDGLIVLTISHHIILICIILVSIFSNVTWKAIIWLLFPMITGRELALLDGPCSSQYKHQAPGPASAANMPWGSHLIFWYLSATTAKYTVPSFLQNLR